MSMRVKHGECSCFQRYLTPLAVLLLLLLTGSRSIQAQPGEEEYRVKAAFLFHIAQLVDWPPDSDEGGDHSLMLCTVGDDPFHGVLETTVEGKAIGDRVLRIRHLQPPDSTSDCQILFLGKEENALAPELVAALNNTPILTVGEADGFLDAGGMICFLLKENRVRFAVNLEAAESAHLKIGSRLLMLAENLSREDRGK